MDRSRVVPVTRERHGHKYWRRPSSSSFTVGEHAAPLVGLEVHRAVLAMPLAFVLLENRYTFSGMLSPVPGVNYFVDAKGQWLGTYVPACFRGFPFSVSLAGENDNRVLCIEESPETISDESGEPFFADTGELAKPVKDVLEFLSKVEQNRKSTDLAVSALADAGVIVEWPISLSFGGKEITVSDLYRIDEARLNNLDSSTFLGLRKAGALPIAYAQLLSMGNVRFFQKLYEIKKQEEKSSKVDLQRFLGEDDIFKF